MPVRGILRSATVKGIANETNAPIYVDDDDNKLKYIPAGSGTTEVEIVDASATQTLTNKTLTSPTITGATLTTATLTSPTINAPVGTVASETVSAANVITAAESGTVFFLSSGTEFASTLPAPAAGLHFTFIVTAAPSGASYTVVTEGGCQVLAGSVHSSVLNDSNDFENAATGTTITFVDGQAVVGDMAELWSDGTSWFAKCFCTTGDGITITG